MSAVFNVDEVFEMAIQLEQNGGKFYRDAAKKVKGGKGLKDLLIELAGMEEQHETTFVQMRETMAQSNTAGRFDPEGEGGQYLKMLVDTRVFFNREIDLTSASEVLKCALGAEKDSIVFYLGLKEVVPARLGKDKIGEIIKEEMSHITILSKKLIELQK